MGHEYSGTPVHKIAWYYDGTAAATEGTLATTSAWVEIEDSLPASVSRIQIYESSGQIVQMGIGPSGSETGIYYIMPNTVATIPFKLDEGMRLAIKAVDADASVGDLIINFFG